MTVVALPQSRLELSARRMSDATSLRAWLADRWAILFSHPEDFAQEQLEMDRWISVLGRSFGARGVTPVALAHAGSDSEQGWLGCLATLDGGSAAVLAPDALADTLADRPAGALRARIARSGPRLAMIVDSSLRCRRTLSYRLPAELPSPLDLIGWAAALRKRDHAEESPYDAPEPSSLARSTWVRNTRYAIAQDGRG